MSARIFHKHPNALNKVFKQYKKNYEVAIGYQMDTKATTTNYPSKKGGRVVSVLEVAAQNEFGTSRIPARPFMKLSVQKLLGKLNRL